MAKNYERQIGQYYLGTSRNGIMVTYNPDDPHLSTHLSDTPNLKELMAEAIGKIYLDGQLFEGDIDMGRIVGTCDVVNTSKKDKIIYGIRKNRLFDGLVPFVKNREGEESSYVSLYLEPKPDKTYRAGSGWVGTFDDEPFPLSSDANENSIKYWGQHAFVYGSQDIEPGTEQTAKPW